jgi:predicted transcriptional regulator
MAGNVLPRRPGAFAHQEYSLGVGIDALACCPADRARRARAHRRIRRKEPRLRAIAGGKAGGGRTLVLVVRAFDDPTTAMQESVNALRQQDGATRTVSVATVRDLLTNERLQLLRVIRKERPESVAALARAVGRTAESVKVDLDALTRVGALTLESPSAKSQVRAPCVATTESRLGWTCDPRPVSCAGLPREPDPVAAWIKLDLLTRLVVGRRLELGATPETDEELDKPMILRSWVARRLVN